MKTLLLRRTKQLLIDNGGLTDIPSKRVDLVEVKLDAQELAVYQRVMLYSQHLFTEYLHQKEAKRDSDYVRVINAESKAKIAKLHDQFRKQFGNQEIKTHVILVLLLRLRQVCCHPGLIDAMLEDCDKSMMDTSTVGNFDLNLVEQLDQIQIDKAVVDHDDDDDEEANKASAKILMRSNPVFKFDRPSAKVSNERQKCKTYF
jgi:transcription termination factor 2